MGDAFIRQKALDLARMEKIELTEGDLCVLVDCWRAGYKARMPGWCFDLLPQKTLANKMYRAGVLSARMLVRACLLEGRSKITGDQCRGK